MKYWLLAPIFGLSACGLGPVICKSDFRVALAEPELAQRVAQEALEKGYTWGTEIISMRSEDPSVTTDDPMIRRVGCTRPDLEGINRPYKCFFRVNHFPSEGSTKIFIIPEVEEKLVAEQGAIAARLRSTLDRDLASCEQT